MDLINEIEESYPVYQWTIDGIHIWPLFRILLSTEIAKSRSQEIMELETEKGWKINFIKALEVCESPLSFVKAYFKDYQNNVKLDRSYQVVALGYTIDRTVKVFDNKWYDTLRDPFVDKFKQSNVNTLLLELAPNNQYRIPRYSSSLFFQPVKDFIMVKKYLFPDQFKINILEYQEVVKFITTKKVGIKVPTLKELQRQFCIIRDFSKYYKKILTKSKATLGMVVCYYGITGMAFILACKELGIPSVDIQHGIAGKLHPAYGKWNNIPMDGLELLPSYFWCWTSSDVQAIEQWNKNCILHHQPILGGNLFLEIWRKSEAEIVKYYDSFIQNLNPDKGVKNILVSLQKDVPCPKFLFDAIKNSRPDWYWRIRLHPAMWPDMEKIRKLFQKVGNPNIDIEYATNLPLPAWLRNIDVHVTSWSTVVLDAIKFGVPSIIIHQAGEDFFERQIKSGIVMPAYNESELLYALNCQIEKANHLRREQIKNVHENNKGIEFLLKIINEKKVNSGGQSS